MKNVELPSYENVIWDAVWEAEYTLNKLIQLDEYTDERLGGYLVLMESQTGIIVTVSRVGIINPEKMEKYMSFAREKAVRLRATHLDDPSVVTSWQSRNPSEDKWGGAVWAGRWIVSFSGLPELADEALSACVAASLEDSPMPEDDARTTAKISSNPYTDALLNEVLR